MEQGDLASWAGVRMIVVLEGVLASPTYGSKGLRRKRTVNPASEWVWFDAPLKRMSFFAHHNVLVEIITFEGQEVADEAAEFLSRYEVPHLSMDAVDFDDFTRSLGWRPEVSGVLDSDPDRFVRYGQKGVAVVKGEDFGG